MKRLILTLLVAIASLTALQAQPGTSRPAGRPMDGITDGLSLGQTETSFMVNVNEMTPDKRLKLDQMANKYRGGATRGILSDLGNAALAGGVGAVVNVIGTEIVNLLQIRSKQKKAWQAMRQKECLFTDSLQSVKGQSDFYAHQSSYGFLDPTGMNFDGITFSAARGGKDVLRMVCHIDTTRLDHMFLHSKFYLVVDTIVFHPYNSFLPNLNANHIQQPRSSEASQDEIDYWNTISHFSFSEQKNPTINIRMDLSSSWINELAQVYQNVPLGSFSVSIPVSQSDLRDSVYYYSRSEAIAQNRPLIQMAGDCFVVPRSFMPVDANNPSWGTGEYKMKVVLTESCRYDPQNGRSSNWHRDYKQLVRMQNHGKARNEYLQNIVTTFRDNSTTILKATYQPILQGVVGQLVPSYGAMSGMGGMGGGGMASAMKAMMGGAAGAQRGAAGAQPSAQGAPSSASPSVAPQTGNAPQGH